LAEYFNNKDRVFYAYLALIASFAIVALYQIIRLFFGPDFLSFGIFTTATSNLVGKWYDLGIVFGLIALFSIIAGEFLHLSKMLKIFTYVVFGLSLCLMAVVNFSLSWIVLGFFSLVIGVYIFSFLKNKGHLGEESEDEKTKKRFPIFPVVSFVICALFVVFGSSLGNVVANRFNISQLEVRPNMSATLSVAGGSLKENVLLGSGPNRFVNQWLLHKDPVVNQSIFWGTDFSYGFGLIPTYLVTTGILGIIAWLLFLFFFLKTGVRSLFKDSTGWDQRFLLLSSFVSSLYLWIMNLIYVPSNTVFYLTFFITGLFLATCANTEEIPVSSFKFSGDSRKSFISVFLVIVLFVGGVLVEYSFVKKYSANLLFQKGVLEARNTGNLDKAESYISRALALYENDLFYRTLTEIGVARINNLLTTAQDKSSQAEIESLRNQFQGVLANTVSGAKKAIEIDPSNYENYVSLAGLYSIVYQYGIKDAYGFALSSYQSAVGLNPQNPGIDLLLARLEIIAKSNEKARGYISSAIAKKPNYTEAVFLLFQLESSEGNVKAAIQSAESATLLSPNDPTAFFQLGLLKFDNKDFKGSAAAFEKAVALNPIYANAKYFLGLSYDKLGRTKDAIAQFEEIKVSNSDNKEIDLIISNLKAGRSPLANNKDQKPPEKRNTLPVKEKGDLKSAE
jgi:tetratricopeptide (TPR) repeat protein